MNIQRSVLISLQLMLLVTVSLAQERHMLHWGVDEGLAGSTVYCSMQDRQGFMWFGTDQGLCRFDGTNFKTYTVADGLSDNDVFWLDEDAKGRIWAICFNAAPCYLEKGVIHRYHPDKAPEATNTVEFPSVIECIRDSIYILFPRTMLVLDTALHIREKYHFNNSLIWMADAGSYMVVAQHDSIFKIVGGEIKPLYGSPSTEDMFNGGQINDGRLYFIFRTLGSMSIASISLADGRDKKVIYSASKHIFNIKFINDSSLRIVSKEKIEVIGPGRTERGDSFFQGRSPTCIFVDKDSNTWIGTHGGGVFMVPKNIVTVYEQPGSPNEKEVLSISGDGAGRIVAGHRYSNIDVIENGRMLPQIRYDRGVGAFRIYSIKERGGDFYMASDYSFLKLDRHFHFSIVYPDNTVGNVKRFDFARSGGFLIANTGGAVRLVFSPKFEFKYFLSGRTTAIAEIGDERYAIGRITGLYIYDHGKTNKFEMDTILSSSRVSDITKDSKGRVWVSTNQNGVFCIDSDRVQNFNIKNGLSSNLCKSLFVDEADNVWVGTNKGLDKISRTQGQYACTVFDVSYGLPTNDINDVYVNKGDIWIATVQGVVYFREGKGNKAAFPTHILSFYAHDSLYSVEGPIDLSYRDNDIRVDYAGISYTSGHNIQYKYLLSGTSVSDTVFTTAGSIRFGSLNPGSYTLYLWAANNSKIWSQVPARVSFVIHPPFWKTNTFLILLLAFILVCIWALSRYRIMGVRRKEREKAEVNRHISELELQALRAQMNPHFIFNALNAIQGFYSNNDELSANKYMTTFSSLIRQILNSSSKNLISIKDEVTLLTNYIELEKMRYKGKFDYDVMLDDGIFPEKNYLPIMLIQPYVENAINHGLRFIEGRQGHLHISFMQHAGALMCTIDDDGIGFRASQELKASAGSGHVSAGIRISRQRIDTLNTIYGQTIEVTFTDKRQKDPNKTGVTVVITLPFIDQNKLEV